MYMEEKKVVGAKPQIALVPIWTPADKIRPYRSSSQGMLVNMLKFSTEFQSTDLVIVTNESISRFRHLVNCCNLISSILMLTM